MSRLKPNKRKKQKKRSNLTNPVPINFSHRLTFSFGNFDSHGASTLVVDCTHRTGCVLELLKTQFSSDKTQLDRDVLCHVLFSILMEIGDLSALMVAFEKSEKANHYKFNTIWQNLASAKKVLKNLVTNLAKDDGTFESNDSICNSIDAVKVDLINIGKLFSELCLSVENHTAQKTEDKK